MTQYTDTPGLLDLAKDAQGHGRSVEINTLARAIDPDGFHVLLSSMVHNDIELRTFWAVKLLGQKNAATFELDVSFEAFKKNIKTKEKDE